MLVCQTRFNRRQVSGFTTWSVCRLVAFTGRLTPEFTSGSLLTIARTQCEMQRHKLFQEKKTVFMLFFCYNCCISIVVTQRINKTLASVNSQSQPQPHVNSNLFHGSSAIINKRRWGKTTRGRPNECCWIIQRNIVEPNWLWKTSRLANYEV